MDEYKARLAELREPKVDDKSTGKMVYPPLDQLIYIAKELIDPANYVKDVASGDASAEYARGIIELLTEFAGFPLGDEAPRAAIAAAIGLEEVIS